jgi:hypothetical protein
MRDVSESTSCFFMITVAARSKAVIVFPRSNTGSCVRISLEAWMSLCVYSAFVLSCVQIVALQRADPLCKEFYRPCISLIN